MWLRFLLLLTTFFTYPSFAQTTIFHNGHIRLFDSARTQAQWIAIEDGHVVAYGRDDSHRLFDKAARIDLKKRYLLPAFASQRSAAALNWLDDVRFGIGVFQVAAQWPTEQAALKAYTQSAGIDTQVILRFPTPDLLKKFVLEEKNNPPTDTPALWLRPSEVTTGELQALLASGYSVFLSQPKHWSSLQKTLAPIEDKSRINIELTVPNFTIGTLIQLGVGFTVSDTLRANQLNSLFGAGLKIDVGNLENPWSTIGRWEIQTLDLRVPRHLTRQRLFDCFMAGELTHGKAGTFAIYSKDPFALNAEELVGLQADAVYVRGNQLWPSKPKKIAE